jgi:hypothetical protein
LAISAPTGAPSSEFRLDRVLAGLPEVQDRVVTQRACMVHAWLVVCTRSGSRRRSSFRPLFAASPAHPGGCPTCAGRAAAVRPALRGHAGLWAGLAAKPAPFVSDTVVAPARGGAIAGLRGGVREAMHDRARVRHVRGLATRATRPYLPPEPYPFKGRRQRQRPKPPQIGALGPRVYHVVRLCHDDQGVPRWGRSRWLW